MSSRSHGLVECGKIRQKIAFQGHFWRRGARPSPGEEYLTGASPNTRTCKFNSFVASTEPLTCWPYDTSAAGTAAPVSCHLRSSLQVIASTNPLVNRNRTVSPLNLFDMRASQCSILYLWLLLYRFAAASDGSAVCSTRIFRISQFPVGSPWPVLGETVVDPMPLRVNGFSNVAKATSVTSELECDAYGSSFKVSGITISKGEVDYEQDGVDRTTTRAFRNANANGVWYVSIDASGPAMCKWVLKVKACDGSGNGNNQNNNNNNNVGGKNDNNELGEEQTTPPQEETSLPPSDAPSWIPSDVPSLSPSLSPSNVQTSFPSDLPSFFPTSQESDVPFMVPTVPPTMTIQSDVPSLAFATASDMPSSIPSSRISDAPSMVPTISIQSDVPSLVPATASDLPSSIPSSRLSDVPSTTVLSAIPSLAPMMVSDIPSSLPSAEAQFGQSFEQSEPPTHWPSLALVDEESDTPSLLPSLPTMSDAPSDTPSNVPSVALVSQSLEPSASDANVDAPPSQQSSEPPVVGPTPYLFDDDIFSSITDESMAMSGFSSVTGSVVLLTMTLLGLIL